MIEQQGLIIVHTGNGKGKTTAALGLALRAWGQGLRILVLQFIKGSWKYGELKAAEALGSRFVMKPLGDGFVSKDKENNEAMAQHRQAAAETIAAAKAAITSGDWDMIILDEINYALKFELIALEDILGLLNEKPEMLHIVLTGRDAHPAVIEKANLVTEMREIKHPYKEGIKAQKGIEF
ncbi:MAG: cob(I)yrinic acid a,c-diamide adenosyltransferase [Sporomusaceae bacterium]|nr:cob(I)yrinic acid a,c-diamide adenosyltransferase [Sporomusaceae bacterium]